MISSYGSILVQVYTSKAQIPVAGATVAFTAGGDGIRRRLLAVRVTDQSGRTAPLELSTPAASMGMAPGGQVPFALVDIWVRAQGYELFRAQGVQIFPGTRTVQEAMLLPLPEYAPPGTQSETVQTTPQNL